LGALPVGAARAPPRAWAFAEFGQFQPPAGGRALAWQFTGAARGGTAVLGLGTDAYLRHCSVQALGAACLPAPAGADMLVAGAWLWDGARLEAGTFLIFGN
jgi:hypothetical protein